MYSASMIKCIQYTVKVCYGRNRTISWDTVSNEDLIHMDTFKDRQFEDSCILNPDSYITWLAWLIWLFWQSP